MADPNSESRQLLAGLGSTPWRLISSLDLSLKLRVYAGGCYTFKDVVAKESSDRVVIAARSTVSKDDKCLPNISFREETLKLKKPLGARQLIHIPVDESWVNAP